jgi:hypothetical protein
MADERGKKWETEDHETENEDVEAHLHKGPGAASRGANDDEGGDEVEAHIHQKG